MYKKIKLPNQVRLVTVPQKETQTTNLLVLIKVGSRAENLKNNGVSHFIEHLMFKGTKKRPTTLDLSKELDGVGAEFNAFTGKDYTGYYIKSDAKHLSLSIDVLSDMLLNSKFDDKEMAKEKGVIVEELRMYKDLPSRYIFDLYEKLQFGDQPIGWDVGGQEEIVKKLTRNDFVKYMKSLYSPANMALIYVGNLPKDINEIAQKYFLDLAKGSKISFKPYKAVKQVKPKVNVFYKKTDQVHIAFGVKGFDRNDPKKYPARILGIILGEGMSSRLFRQVREKRGLAYSVGALHAPYIDTGFFVAHAGLKLEKIEEGISVVKDEFLKTVSEKVTVEELKKAKEMERGRLAIRSESTNFLAEYFGVNFVLDRKIETFEEYLKKIDAITLEDVQEVAKELFQKNKFNLQIIGPFKTAAPFAKILNS